ncbi:MAG TPA: hypothetical protein ENN47_10305 [Mesotoga infera]|uniref:Nuclear transport factor 2 family protein n=1 Tax=Mesotoga infera TaxID=1236046 RepID=A0A7C1CUU6_9BACT|nr:hypothetical protein [Mesotoga infera]
MRKKSALFTVVAIVFLIMLTSGCTGYILVKPDTVVARLEREINRAREDSILELYSDEVWIETSGSPSGRMLPKKSIALFYADFFELYDDIDFSLNVEDVVRGSREATITVSFSLEYSHDGKSFHESGESVISLNGVERQWKISGEYNNPILSFFEPASM